LPAGRGLKVKAEQSGHQRRKDVQELDRFFASKM